MTVSAYSNIDIHNHTESEQRIAKLRFVVSFGGLALVLAAVVATSLLNRKDGVPQLAGLIGALLLSGLIIHDAVRDLFHGVRHMTELVAIALLACIATGRYLEAGIVAFLLLAAELLLSRSALGARQAIEGLVRMAPSTAHRISDDGAEREVAAALLVVGNKIRIRPGEAIPSDGEIISGKTSINESSITGESLPVDKGPGAVVFAGSVNLTGSVDVEVTRVGDDTTLGQVREMILNAEQTKIPIMRLIDQYILWYTPVVLMLVFAIWYFTRNPQAAISALIVTCPSAFVLATPTAMVAALSCAARHGMLVKDVRDFETAGRINAMAFDKTGTLTTGQLAVTRLTPAQDVDPAHLLGMAVAVESHSNHPIAQAVVRVASEAGLTLHQAKDVHEEAGMGVRAQVNGAEIMIGRNTWLESNGVDIAAMKADAQDAEGLSLLYVAEDKKGIGWIGLEDKARDQAKQAFAELKTIGIRHLTMFTGDRWSVARRVAGELGCTEVEAECLPERKLELVEKMKDSGLNVAVVGDGVNDAPALAAGDIGIAMGAAGSDVAIHSASIALMSNDLERLPFLIRLSRQTCRTVNHNLLFALVFISLGLTVAALQKLTATVAVLFYIVGAMAVIFNSARLVRFGEETRPEDMAHL